ncbi:hypothetical protein [Heliophilum fasciatum]|uniref:Uncharacterized protein n=1 Tax=Heliophilum fasciatum TaxID=35700 RepID=A0A4R2R6J3_9FIRM|nr:hypothetical protein [Heliophilum fasciatum]MCW2279506.1 hypothetical protein [Heliophilum fasciatum]TCP58670.1 hypothetical protein EDD73_1554 [Heliophilum fasciatum]
MADVVFSTKVDESVKARFDALVPTNMTQKDFFQQLVTSFELAKVRETMPEQKQLDQLRYHVNRIEEIYIAYIKEATFVFG